MRRRYAPPNAGRQCVKISSSVWHSSTRRTFTVRRTDPAPFSDIDSKVATLFTPPQMCDNPRMHAGWGRICRRLAILLAASVAALLTAQTRRPAELSAGKLLVASRDLGDPNFAETVVLLVHYDEDSVVGLVLNRRTKVPIARLLEEVKGASERSDPIYVGGPVGKSGILALLRSRSR